MSKAGFVRLFFFLVACVAAFAPHQMCAQSGVSKEYEIKAAFLFHFTQFVEWPSTNATNAIPFRIGVPGDNPFGNALNEIVKGESVHGHKLIVEYSQDVEDLTNCRILFISNHEQQHLPAILEKLRGRPILTVSDCDGFARQGGIIAFYLNAGKVRFQINPEAADRAGLKLSSQLMRLGQIVKP